jgi:hypothetical protein
MGKVTNNLDYAGLSEKEVSPKNIFLDWKNDESRWIPEFSDVPFSDKTKSPQGDAPVNVG